MTAIESSGRRTLRLSGTDGCPRWRGRIHLLAFAAALPAGSAMIARRPSPAVAVYVLGLACLYGVSAAYHLLPLTAPHRHRLRQADHAMIYVFTAASVTPFCHFAVGGRLGSAVITLAWVGAGIGVYLKVCGFERSPALGGGLYIVLGWLSVVTLPRAVHHLDATQIDLMAAVALLYSAGVMVLFTRRPDPVPHVFGYHEIWHGAVVAASACFFVVVWGLATPPR